jgi:hypothetical protein
VPLKSSSKAHGSASPAAANNMTISFVASMPDADDFVSSLP